MAVAVAQQITSGNQASGSSFMLSLSGIGATSTLVVMTANNRGSSSYISAITDNAATPYTWSRITNFADGAGDALDVWQGIGGSGGSVTVTVSLGTSCGYNGQLYELTGTNLTNPVDRTSGAAPAINNGTSTPGGPGTLATVTPSATGELVMGCLCTAGGNTGGPSSPWTNVGADYGGSTTRSGVVSGTGYSTSWTLNGSNMWITASIIFQPPATAAAAAPFWMTQPMVPIRPSVPVGA